jgi:glycosyltransferase involved in cell wall biosynthesis
VRLVIAGDGELRNLVRAAAVGDERIEWRGWLDESSVTRLMSGALATVVPSEWYEGLPLVILRSLSVGTPVLASDLENISKELLEDGAGWAFRTGLPADLARAMDAVASQPETLSAMRQRARASFDARYSPAVDTVRLEALYRSLLSRRP